MRDATPRIIRLSIRGIVYFDKDSFNYTAVGVYSFGKVSKRGVTAVHRLWTLVEIVQRTNVLGINLLDYDHW
mgnify:CR=1 FL=1